MSSLTIGDAVPWFTVFTDANTKYHFDTMGGLPIILYFFDEVEQSGALAVLSGFQAQQTTLLQLEAVFFAVGVGRPRPDLRDRLPDSAVYRLLWDPEGKASRQCGYDVSQNSQTQLSSILWVLDQRLRVQHIFTVAPETATQTVKAAIAAVQSLPPLPTGNAMRQAPVLFIPGVFEPEFCQQLIALLQNYGSQQTGVLEEQQNGQAMNVALDTLKRRHDLPLEKAGREWVDQLIERVIRRVRPEIEKAFQYSVSSFERPVVACYDAASQGFFGRHRDNMSVEGAKRRFAMTINLNTGDYEGGCLQFPEYGQQLFSPAMGEAVIFGCSIMHEVTPVTQGQRFAFLLFFNEPDLKPQAVTASPQKASKSTVKKSKRSKSGRGFQ